MISEFDLVLPGQIDKNIRLFNIETECLTYLYTRLYTPTKETGKPWKIIVHIVPEIKEATCYMVLGTINVEVEGNIDNYFLANDKDKKIIALEYLMQGIQKVAKEFNYDMNQFLIAQQKVIDCNYINEFRFKKPVKNKAKSLSAEIFVEHGMEEAKLSLIFRNKQKEIVKTQYLTSTTPSIFCYHKYLGKLVWTDDNTVEIYSRNGDIEFTVNAKLH